MFQKDSGESEKLTQPEEGHNTSCQSDDAYYKVEKLLMVKQIGCKKHCLVKCNFKNSWERAHKDRA